MAPSKQTFQMVAAPEGVTKFCQDHPKVIVKYSPGTYYLRGATSSLIITSLVYYSFYHNINGWHHINETAVKRYNDLVNILRREISLEPVDVPNLHLFPYGEFNKEEIQKKSGTGIYGMNCASKYWLRKLREWYESGI